ncbi:hypothetical protein LWT32_23555, partial [Enterobacter hormaechei]|nr:hypothetical protein [Enterobacter hormaechei]
NYKGEDLVGLGLIGNGVLDENENKNDDAQKYFTNLNKKKKEHSHLEHDGDDLGVENKSSVPSRRRRPYKQYSSHSRICSNALPFLKTGLLFSLA